MPRVIFDSANLQRAVQTGWTRPVPAETGGLRKCSLDDRRQFCPPVTVSPVAQFRVIDASDHDAGTGLMTTPKIRVTSAAGGDDPICGQLNGLTYASMTVTLPTGAATYYIYAVDGQIYALTHTFYSSVVPSFCIARVTVTPNTAALTIYQSDVPIHVDGVTAPGDGFSEITPSLSYSANRLSASYTYSGRVVFNGVSTAISNLPLPTGGQSVTAWLEKLISGLTETVNHGVVITPDQPLPAHEWSVVLLAYRLTQTSAENTFIVTSRLDGAAELSGSVRVTQCTCSAS